MQHSPDSCELDQVAPYHVAVCEGAGQGGDEVGVEVGDLLAVHLAVLVQVPDQECVPRHLHPVRPSLHPLDVPDDPIIVTIKVTMRAPTCPE